MIKYLPLLLLLGMFNSASSQTRKANYHPCFLMDSIDKNLAFIRLNAPRIFIDSFDCRQDLLDSIGIKYLQTRKPLYLDALAAIRQNPAAKVEELYTDVITRFMQDDFGGFIDQLYTAKGKYLSLEKELIAAMNMIVDGRPLKKKYMGQLNVEIEKAKDKKDKYKQAYLEKLKLKIEEEKY